MQTSYETAIAAISKAAATISNINVGAEGVRKELEVAREMLRDAKAEEIRWHGELTAKLTEISDARVKRLVELDEQFGELIDAIEGKPDEDSEPDADSSTVIVMAKAAE